MLIPVLFIIALAAALIGFAAGLGLWQALLLFVVAYLLANLICVLLAFSTCLLVKDMEKPIEKENPACRLAAVTAFGLVCGYLGVRAKTIGQQLLPQDDKYLVVCNHRSGFDPVVMMYQLRRHKVSFVAKPSVMSLPIIGRVAMVQSLDRDALAVELSKRAVQANTVVPALVQVNIAREPQKSGIDEDDLIAFLTRCSTLPGIRIEGLMSIMPFVDDPETIRPYFRRMRAWFDRLRDDNLPGVHMNVLSMGMSGDCLVAAEEGATMVRLGRALFGARPAKNEINQGVDK